MSDPRFFVNSKNILNKFFKLVAYIEPELYKQFYAISKNQAGNYSFNRWEDYSLVVDKTIFEKVKQFVPINNFGPNKNNKGFRTKKNGIDTGLFTKMDDSLIPNHNLIMNNSNAQNNDNNIYLNKISISNPNVNHIRIIPKNNIDADE